MNVRQKPNKRFKCKFYVLGSNVVDQPATDALGQLEQDFSLLCTGLFAKEKPRQPREVKEGDRTVNEQESILVGTWTRTLSRVTHGMYCFIPTLSKLYAVSGDATDPYGDRKVIHMYIVDNVTRSIKKLIPGATL